jgi:hypothetical protein
MLRMMTTSTADIRRWAQAAGLAVGDRGRLSPDVVAAYHEAHAKAPASAATIAMARPEPPRTTSPYRTVRAKQHWDWTRREGGATAS